MRSSRQIFIGFIAITLTFCDCHTTDVEEYPILIVPGEAIDGVRLGDSRQSVESTLGKPDRGGTVDGVNRAWFSAEYSQGPHAGLSVFFVDIDNHAGPVDLLAVHSPYVGKTKEGIGIRSSLWAVHQTYGIPVKTIVKLSDNYIADFYCFQQRKLEIHYVDSLVTGMSIGYYLPMLDGTNPCE